MPRLRAAGAYGFAVVVATACSTEPPAVPPRDLPTASATLHFATVSLATGSYCWSGDGAVCADSAPVDALLRTGYIKPYRTAGGFTAKIKLKSASPATSLNARLVQAPAGAPQIALAGYSFTVPASPPTPSGTYVYEVKGKWPQGSVTFYLAIDLIPGVA